MNPSRTVSKSLCLFKKINKEEKHRSYDLTAKNVTVKLFKALLYVI